MTIDTWAGDAAMTGRGSDRESRDLATAIADAIADIAAAREALERARIIAARHRWATMAISCGTAGRRLDAVARKLEKEGGRA